MRFDPASADCLIFTYKEGLLASAAHDLQIRVQRFTIALDDVTWHLEARFDATSLRVVGVIRDGTLDADALGELDKRTIERHIVEDVLHADRHPEVRFTSTAAEARGGDLAVSGTLALLGETRPLTVPVRRIGSGWIAEIRVHQPDFGVRPYRAMLGTLRVRADVLVRVTIPSRHGTGKA